MRVVIEYNGFHGHSEIILNLKGKRGDAVYISGSQAEKIYKEVCGMPSCSCGEGLGEGAELILPDDGNIIEVDGNYPQRT